MEMADVTKRSELVLCCSLCLLSSARVIALSVCPTYCTRWRTRFARARHAAIATLSLPALQKAAAARVWSNAPTSFPFSAAPTAAAMLMKDLMPLLASTTWPTARPVNWCDLAPCDHLLDAAC